MDWLEAARKSTGDYLEILTELVAIDSGTYSKVGVDAVGSRLADLLEAEGCQVRRHRLKDYGNCFEATLKGPGEGHILLLGHTDTVYPDGTAAERPLRVEDGRAYGPGAADMKGGLLLGVCALRALRSLGPLPFGRLTFFINSDEEIGSPASRELYAAAARRAQVSLVLEPARETGHIVSARKGVGMAKIRVRGRSAHAGVNPQEGASAVEALVQMLSQLKAMEQHLKGARFNVGVIEGGTRSNVVAERARAEIDIRVEDEAAWQRAHGVLRQVVGLETVPGVEAILEGGLNNPPMPLTEATEHLLELAQEAAEAVGMRLRHTSSGGGSDANYVVAEGTPCLDGLGPQGSGYHSPDEHILVESIVPRTALLAALIARVSPRAAQIKSLLGKR